MAEVDSLDPAYKCVRRIHSLIDASSPDLAQMNRLNSSNRFGATPALAVATLHADER